ncbi:MAG: hypothetical protein AAFQ51_19315 [Pseudomonadota bacterium]
MSTEGRRITWFRQRSYHLSRDGRFAIITDAEENDAVLLIDGWEIARDTSIKRLKRIADSIARGEEP